MDTKYAMTMTAIQRLARLAVYAAAIRISFWKVEGTASIAGRRTIPPAAGR